MNLQNYTRMYEIFLSQNMMSLKDAYFNEFGFVLFV